jgi:hypothetical protein
MPAPGRHAHRSSEVTIEWPAATARRPSIEVLAVLSNNAPACHQQRPFSRSEGCTFAVFSGLRPVEVLWIESFSGAAPAAAATV